MISFLEGKIEHLGEKYLILNTGGIGYKVTMVPKLLSILSKSQPSVKGVDPELAEGLSKTIKLFIHSQMNMREGTFDMYGFTDRENLDLFHLLTSVSGIGPKGAMNVLSVVEPKQLKIAVINEDADYLKKVSGLGPKTASRLILELKNKLDYIDIGDMKGLNLGEEGQAIDALMSLGYSQYQAKGALKEVSSKTKTLQDRVKEALKILGKTR